MSWRQPAETIRQLISGPLLDTDFVGVLPRVYLGWPAPMKLVEDARATPSIVHVSIFPRPAVNTSRYKKVGSEAFQIATVSETVVVAGNTVTFGGTLTVGDNVFICVNGRFFGFNIGAATTLALIASTFATAINASSGLGLVASAVGAVLTINAGTNQLSYLTGVAYGQAVYVTEVARVNRVYQISIWAQSPEIRFAYEDVILRTLCNLNFITLPDATHCRIDFVGDNVSDAAEPSSIAKHDLLFEVEYPILIPHETNIVANTLIDLLPVNLSAAIALSNSISSGVLVATTETIPFHQHFHEIPLGAKPGTVFTLTMIPRLNSEMLFLNNMALERVGSTPGANEYSITENVITIGMTIYPTDKLVVHYEI